MLLEDIEEAGTLTSEIGIRSNFQIHFFTYQVATQRNELEDICTAQLAFALVGTSAHGDILTPNDRKED